MVLIWCSYGNRRIPSYYYLILYEDTQEFTVLPNPITKIVVGNFSSPSLFLSIVPLCRPISHFSHKFLQSSTLCYTTLEQLCKISWIKQVLGASMAYEKLFCPVFELSHRFMPLWSLESGSSVWSKSKKLCQGLQSSSPQLQVALVRSWHGASSITNGDNSARDWPSELMTLGKIRILIWVSILVCITGRLIT